MWMRGEKDAWHTFLDSSHFLRGQNSTRVLCRVCLAVGTADSPWQCISTFCNRNITTHTRLHLPSRLMVGWVSCFLSMASVFLWWHLLGTAVYFLWHLPHGWTCNLVDPASSYMLVSKIKPCMSKYICIHRNCGWLFITVIVSWSMNDSLDICGNSRANTCFKTRLDGRGALIRYSTSPCFSWTLLIHSGFSNRLCRR